MKKISVFNLSACILFQVLGCAQQPVFVEEQLPIIKNVQPQPLLAQVVRLREALSFLGSSLSEFDSRRITALEDKPLTSQIADSIQKILDPYCIAMVDINPESRVKVVRGPAKARLHQGGWTSFLVKVQNQAGVTAQLKVSSKNSAPLLHMSSGSPRVEKENVLTAGQVANRFLEMQFYRNRPLLSNLSGFQLEYAVLQIYCKDSGQREAELAFNIGQGTQDIGFRNAVSILFNISRSVKLVFKVRDSDGSPAMASFTITDGIERVVPDSLKDYSEIDYRVLRAQLEYWKRSPQLKGIYPLPSRRVAATDEYPDFFFQPQVYRTDGEYVLLPPGQYTVTFTRGPEYIPQTVALNVPEGKDSLQVTFNLKRWINMAALGWFSGDHHVHAAGCSHYESPEEGVAPMDMWRQVVGEDLNVAAVLAWGPSWYHQKSFFSGEVNALSTNKNVLRYDVEVSGFPSSHAGHIVLLRLKEDDYPGTTTIEEWPSWTLPILKWAKSQGAATGYAHSGWGLEPLSPTKDLPNYVIPKMDNIGANEYIVTVTQQAVDFFSAGDTPAQWELNMWYHTLNCGFRTRLSGETDFPCIFDERVGLARSYFKTESNLNYDAYVEALKIGRSYVSDGKSHIIDFSVEGIEVGTHNSELPLKADQTVNVKAKVVAFLPEKQDAAGAAIASRKMDEQPYWNIERARIGSSRKVKVELLANGEPVDAREIIADGTWQELSFNYAIKKSAWMALRIYQSCHTNPIFIIVDGKSIAESKSAQWCRAAVDQCWKMKEPKFRSEEKAAAQAAYNNARAVYDKIIESSKE